MILVAGIANLETSVPVDAFPVDYRPVRYATGQVRSRVAGPGANLATALLTLGSRTRLAGFVGTDPPGQAVWRVLTERGLDTSALLDAPQTPQSAVFVDPGGQRAIYTDMKGLHSATYPLDDFDRALDGVRLVVLTNIGFCQPLLARARQLGVPIATDVHAIEDLDDPYNSQFMAAASVLACSHERLPCPPAAWAHAVLDRYPRVQTVLVGMGNEGCLLVVRDQVTCHVPAATPGPVRNTAGAGDALLAAYLHATHTAGQEPASAAERAVLVAGYAVSSPEQRYLTSHELDDLHANAAGQIHARPTDADDSAPGYDPGAQS